MNAQWILSVSFLVVVFVAAPRAAHAIRNQALNPHSDAAADISYIQDSTKKPDETNHFHLPLRDGETISVSSDPSNYGLRSNKGWAAFETWDNNLLRFEDTPKTDDAANALINNFAHGYIDATKPPLYMFESNVPADARPILTDSFSTWAKEAKAQIAGKTSPAGNPLALGIAFKEVGKDQTDQFYYRFSDNLQGSRGVYAEWVVSQDRVTGPVVSKNVMIYESNPLNFVRAPDGVTLKVKTDLVSSPMFTKNVGWSFDKTPDAIPVDLQYVKDGVTTESLPRQMLTTDTGLKIPCDDIINFYQMDFYMIALHETGDILGLLHAPGDPANSIMRENIKNQASWNKTFQQIDADSAYGAAMLYTIAVPEPTTLAIALIATLGATNQRRARFYLTF